MSEPTNDTDDIDDDVDLCEHDEREPHEYSAPPEHMGPTDILGCPGPDEYNPKEHR